MHRRALLMGLAAATPGRALAGARAKPLPWPSSQGLLDRYVAEGRVPGAVLAVSGEDARPIFLSAGRLDFGGAPVGPDSLFRIYSMTKPVTGVAAMQLIEEGQLGLDQPLAEILPGFGEMKLLSGVRAAAPIRIRDLLTHTAGFSYHINSGALAGLYAAWGLKPGTRQRVGLAGEKAPPRDLEEFGERLARLPLEFDPGTRFQYSLGLDLMGLVIQRAAGKPFWQVLQERIFAPLGMADTDFVVPAAKIHRLTALYAAGPTGLALADPASAASPFARDRDLPSGGGGLVSSARDYARFCAMLLNDGELDGVRIMRTATARLARSNLMAPGLASGLTGGANGFGAGMQVVAPGIAPLGSEPPGSFGWSGQAGTTMWVDPVNKFHAVQMIQYLPGGAYPIYGEVRQAVYRDLAGQGRVASAL